MNRGTSFNILSADPAWCSACSHNVAAEGYYLDFYDEPRDTFVCAQCESVVGTCIRCDSAPIECDDYCRTCMAELMAANPAQHADILEMLADPAAFPQFQGACRAALTIIQGAA